MAAAEKKTEVFLRKLLAVLTLLPWGLGAPPATADTLYKGIDTWVTKPDGRSFHDFSRDPLPVGFFCARSAPFTGRVALRGEPIASTEPELLGTTDTIIERMDDVTFDSRGVATARIRFRGLSLVSISPIQTACGAYRVRVNLEGEQPVTTMRIFKKGDEGGRFLAPLALQAKITFEPVSGYGRLLQIVRIIRFDANPRNEWSLRPAEQSRKMPNWIKIDTDGDNHPDAYIPGPTNFAAGSRNKDGVDNCHRGYDAYHCPAPSGGWTSVPSPGLLPLCEELCCGLVGPVPEDPSTTACVTQAGTQATCGPPWLYFCSWEVPPDGR